MQKIDTANAEALRRMLAGDPVLVDVVPAGEAMRAWRAHHILHAGPPIGWERMCGPLRGAIAGIAVFEGWAKDLDDAAAKAAGGAFRFEPNHSYDAVGPMTGMTTRSQPVLVVENRAFGNRAYCAINEGLGKVMRFGGNDAEVLARLAWLRDALGPALGRAIRATGGIALKPIIARGLTMGDEMHQRNVACSSLLLRLLAPALARTAEDSETLARCLDFIGRNDQFFLNVAMAMGKAITDPARGIDGSSVVTAMSRNGTDFGIRVSGTGDAWFTAPVEMPVGLYFPGYQRQGRQPRHGRFGDRRDRRPRRASPWPRRRRSSASSAPGRLRSAAVFTRSMGEITVGSNPEWTIPALDGAGVPTGIDIRLVVETGIAPTINTGIAHREPGVGQVGAGVVQGAARSASSRRWSRSPRGWACVTVIRNEVRKGFYLDSVALDAHLARASPRCRASRRPRLMIGTPANKAILREAGLLGRRRAAGRPGDLIIAVRAADARSGRRRAWPRRGACWTGRAAPQPAAPPGSRARCAGAMQQMPRRQPGADLGARRLRRRRGAEGAAARPQRHDLLATTCRCDEEVALKREARDLGLPGHGPRLRHGHHRRRAAGVRQRRAAGRHRHHRRLRHRHAGGLLPDRQRRGGASRMPSAPADAISRREVGGIATLTAIDLLDRRPGDPAYRADLQAAGARGRQRGARARRQEPQAVHRLPHRRRRRRAMPANARLAGDAGGGGRKRAGAQARRLSGSRCRSRRRAAG